MKISLLRGFLVLALLTGLPTLLGACDAQPADKSALSLSGPVELELMVGERLPGTDVELQRIAESEAFFDLSGQAARKKVGDSLDWKGTLAPGLDAVLSLRIIWIGEAAIQLGGTARLEVKEIAPQAGAIQEDAGVRYAVPVRFSVRQGENVPGTVITFVAQDADRGAEFSGVEGYPYRKLADSLAWEGRLRENVWVKMDLRVLIFSQTSLQVGGIATVWAQP